MRVFKIIPALVAGAVGLVAATGANAVSLSFSNYLTGANVGNTPIATLEATQNGSDVDFVLTHTLAGQPQSFVDYLNLSYNGNLAAISGSNTGGVAYESFDKGAGIDAGYSYNVKVDYPNSNRQNGALRLNFGENSAFSVQGASLSDFDFLNGNALLHMNGIGSNGSLSTKYGAVEAPPVPLPAAGLLLIGGLSGLGLWGRLRRKA